MNREQFEKTYLHQNVVITLFDDTTVTGKLYRTDDALFKHEPELHLRKNFYLVKGGGADNYIFRKSHIKRIEVK